MSRYQFRLATMQKLREAERDERRHRLAEALEAERVLLGRIAELEQERADVSRQSLQAVRPGLLDIDVVVQISRYELLVEAQLRGLEKRNEQLQEEIERRHDAVVEADRAVRVLEKLDDRWYAEHQRQQAKVEQQLLDEIGLRRSRGTQ